MRRSSTRLFIDGLLAHIQPGDEAVVPRRVRDGKSRVEPFAALYDRDAFMREGLPCSRPAMRRCAP